MKLRLIPIVISVLISSIALFGGWFVYHSVAVENPLNEVIHQIPGIDQFTVTIDSKEVQVNMKVKPDTSLRDIRQQIAAQGASIIGKRELNLNITNDPSTDLEHIWSQALFPVAQAMESKQYEQIPLALNRISQSVPGLQTTSEMDDQFVYVRLVKGHDSKFIQLPRVPAVIGAWPNA